MRLSLYTSLPTAVAGVFHLQFTWGPSLGGLREISVKNLTDIRLVSLVVLDY
ncbi:MAG: hypothetical protein R2828_01160 [Saprospiraceae bacterium]